MLQQLAHVDLEVRPGVVLIERDSAKTGYCCCFALSLCGKAVERLAGVNENVRCACYDTVPQTLCAAMGRKAFSAVGWPFS